jgi:hypothetical protein
MMARRAALLIEGLSGFSLVSLDIAGIVAYVRLVNYRFRPLLSYSLLKNLVIIERCFSSATDTIK